MRVLYLTNIPSPYKVDFFNELGKMCELTVLFERQDASDRESAWFSSSVNNFKAEYLKGIKFGADSALCFGVNRWLHKDRFDICIIGGFGTPTGMLALEILILKRIPFILNSDGGFIKKENKLKFFAKKHFVKHAQHYLSAGITTTKCFEYYGAGFHDIYEYPFSSLHQRDILDEVPPYSAKKAYRMELNIDEDQMILSAGQFIYRKGFDVLLEACNKISKQYGIYIAGGEPNQEYLNLKQKYQLHNVHFIGFKKKEELRKYFMASDLFVLPTREDTWGLVINEAMACGLPVITTDRCIAGLELVNDYENGFIVPVERADILAERIEDVMSNQELAASMGKGNPQKIKPYTVENMARRHFEILSSLTMLDHCTGRPIWKAQA